MSGEKNDSSSIAPEQTKPADSKTLDSQSSNTNELGECSLRQNKSDKDPDDCKPTINSSSDARDDSNQSDSVKKITLLIKTPKQKQAIEVPEDLNVSEVGFFTLLYFRNNYSIVTRVTSQNQLHLYASIYTNLSSFCYI